MMIMMVSTPKGSYSAKAGDNDCNVHSSHYSLRTALCESIRYQAKSEHKRHMGLDALLKNQLAHGPSSKGCTYTL